MPSPDHPQWAVTEQESLPGTAWALSGLLPVTGPTSLNLLCTEHIRNQPLPTSIKAAIRDVNVPKHLTEADFKKNKLGKCNAREADL